MANLNKVLAVPDQRGHDQTSETDPLICLINWLCQEDSINRNCFAYSTNNFDIEDIRTYEKAMAFDNIEEWAAATKQEIDLLIQYQTWDLIPKTNIKLGY